MIFVLASGYRENFYKNFDKDNFNVLYINEGESLYYMR